MHSAWVPDFRNDVLLSYAHVDNDAPAGWVAEFVAHLQKWLDKELGRKDRCRLWWDERSLPRTATVSATIEQEVRNSAVLCVLLSTGYVESDWCAEERAAFLDASEKSPWPDRRIFVVDIGSLPRNERPQELQDLGGFRLFEEKPNGRTAPLPASHEDRDDYVGDIAWSIAKRLNELRAAAQSQNLDVHFISSLPVKRRPACTAWADKTPVQIVEVEG